MHKATFKTKNPTQSVFIPLQNQHSLPVGKDKVILLLAVLKAGKINLPHIHKHTPDAQQQNTEPPDQQAVELSSDLITEIYRAREFALLLLIIITQITYSH